MSVGGYQACKRLGGLRLLLSEHGTSWVKVPGHSWRDKWTARSGRLSQLYIPRDFHSQREFFIDNPLVRIHLIIEMILVDRPCAM